MTTASVKGLADPEKNMANETSKCCELLAMSCQSSK